MVVNNKSVVPAGTTASPLLQAFEGVNKTVPVWFMRQAGRFLPEYRELKKQYTLDEMFKTPELAAEITVLPVDILGVDAAILFADILTLPARMGFDISFDNNSGPHIGNLISGISASGSSGSRIRPEMR